jgi:cell division protein FtsB
MSMPPVEQANDYNNNNETANTRDQEFASCSHDVTRINLLIENLHREILALINERDRLRLELVREHNDTRTRQTAPKILRPLYEYDK